VVMRFLQPLHEEPGWFYLPALLLGMLPWTLLMPAGIGVLIRRSSLSLNGLGEERVGGRRPGELGFVLLCCVWCLLFFSAAACKRIGYILPAMPPLALMLGYTLVKRLSGLGLTHRQSKIEKASSRSSIFYPRSSALPWAACALATFALLFLAIHTLLPAYYRKFSLRAQVRALLDGSYHREVPVVCYPHIWDSVCFYLQRSDIRGFSAERRTELLADLRTRPKTLVVVKSNHWLNDLRQALPEDLEFVSQGRQGNVTAGVVQRRQNPAKNAVAKR
jgi:hypothetical protein